MQDHFLKYLDQVASVEAKLMYQDAMETLTRAGISDHEYFIDEMMETDESDAGTFLVKVNALLSGALHTLMLRFGVSVDNSCPLDISTDILKGTLAMDNWSDPESLSGACDISEGAEAAFAGMLSIVTSRHETDYLPQLLRVSPDLIARVAALNQTFSSDSLPPTHVRQRAQRRLEAYFTKRDAPILSRAIREMLLLGGSYQGLLSQYADVISALPIDSAINELVGFALASDLEDGELADAIAGECQGWWDDKPDNALRASAAIRTQLKETLTS